MMREMISATAIRIGRDVWALALLILAVPAGVAAGQQPQTLWRDTLRTLRLTDTLEAWGNLGGVAVDRLGFIYVANFRDAVWQVAPDGEVRLMANSLYGASGNAVDARGNLYQANFYANTISTISRTGDIRTVVEEGLAGPVGLAFDADQNLYVCNCGNNTVGKIGLDREVVTFASSADFNCPNGLTFDDRGDLYVVSFANDHIVKITPDGTVSRLATLPPGGNAHIAFTRGALYVTRIRTNRVYQVTRDGEAAVFAGSGELALRDGPAQEAALRRPNGIAVSPSGDLIYINNLIGEWQSGEKGALAIRVLDLVTLSEILRAAHAAEGVDGLVKAYRDYKADPEHQKQHTLAEVNGLAYRFLNIPDVRAAMTVFELNAESYPDDWRVHNGLGFVYGIIGRTDAAIAAYERSLELNPDNANARRRLSALREGSGDPER